MNQHRDKQITNRTYDESEMRSRRNNVLEIPRVSNNITKIQEQKTPNDQAKDKTKSSPTQLI